MPRCRKIQSARCVVLLAMRASGLGLSGALAGRRGAKTVAQANLKAGSSEDEEEEEASLPGQSGDGEAAAGMLGEMSVYLSVCLSISSSVSDCSRLGQKHRTRSVLPTVRSVLC
jgi:hypothetical protein